MKQPRPLLSASGNLMHMPRTAKPLSVYEQVGMYLSRMRYTLPLPCTEEELYSGMMPPEIQHWQKEGVFSASMESLPPGTQTNLLLTIYQANGRPGRGQGQTWPARDIAHACLEETEDYIEALRGARGFERIFWFSVPPYMPVPRNSANTPFFVPKSHVFYEQIGNWLKEAFRIEDEIEASLQLIEEFCVLCKTAAQVRYTWPDLMNFVSIPSPVLRLSKSDRDKLRGRVENVISESARNEITTQLTRAVMLPERPPTLRAWVKFYTKEDL